MGYVIAAIMGAAIMGVVLGAIFTLLIVRRSKSGVLKVYIPDDPEEQPYLYVELNKPVGLICDEQQVLFTVDVKNIKTHK